MQPLLEKGSQMYAMFSDYCKYDWVLQVQRYDDIQSLLDSFEESVIAPAERKARELSLKRSLALGAT